jgi:XTP/dITP diphosphohydrolase
MKIILASSNEHKKKEIEQLFVGHQILLPKDLGLSFDCIENGQTFLENAMIKAKALQQALKGLEGYAILADDSGLIVDALPGQLGVKTARFGSKDGVTLLEAHEKNKLLLSKLEGLKEEQRTARFICAMVLLKDAWTTYCVQEATEGRILESEIGLHGFGYDPVFYCNEAKSPMALLSDEGKNSCSHRGKAARSMLTLIG